MVVGPKEVEGGGVEDTPEVGSSPVPPEASVGVDSSSSHIAACRFLDPGTVTVTQLQPQQPGVEPVIAHWVHDSVIDLAQWFVESPMLRP